MEAISIEKNTEKRGFKKIVKKNIYKWHRIIGLITIIPVIFWTISGLMHPFMSHWFKPKIAKEFLMPQTLKKEDITLSLQQVLKQNEITQFKNFRVLSFGGQTYYQVKRMAGKLSYFNTRTGLELSKGDLVYAEWMARELSQDSISKIKTISVQSDFDKQYKFVNRLLPVYKVQFERPDGLDIFVETESGRMATFNTDARKGFIWIFDVFHNWSFLEAISNNWLRVTVMLILLIIISVSTFSGLVIYGLMWKKFKKPRNNKDQVGILRKYHRQIGLWVSFVTFTFSLSGAYHVSTKYTPDERLKYVYEPTFKTEDLQMASFALPLDWSRLTNISLVKLKKQDYFQVFYKKDEDKPASIEYLDARSGMTLKEGNLIYAKYLANKFANMEAKLKENTNVSSAECCEPSSDLESEDINEANLLKTEWMTKFDREYGFVNKRLPVMKLAYNTENHATFYIETGTGRLAAKVEDADRREGYSFAIFHKYLFMDWAGKDVRDIVTMISALGVLVVSLFGLALFLKIK